MNKSLIIFLIFTLLILEQVNCDELKTVFLIHRHGDRSPSFTYPNDPYKNESYWPNGLGQLTNRGKLRMFNVGQFIKKEYTGFLSGNLHEEVYVRSSAKERCLESVELLVNGIYKPKKGGIWDWNSDELWLPVPVITQEYEKDHMLNVFSNCEANENEYKKVLESNFFKNLNQNNKELYKNLTNFSGNKIESHLDGDDLYDTLSIENENIENYKYPDWVTEQILDDLKKMHLAKFRMFSQFESMISLKFSSFLSELVSKISETLKNSTDTKVKKLNIYSTHDIFLFNLFVALNITNHELPPYGSTIIIETYQSNSASNKSGSIKLRYLNETLSDNYLQFKINPLKIQKLGDKESYTDEEFFNSFSHLLMNQSELDKKCMPFIAEAQSNSLAYILVIVFESIAILVLASFILIMNCLIKRIRRNFREYDGNQLGII